MRLTTLTTIAVLPLLAACAAVQSDPVPVLGPATSLAGEWRGSYESPQSGRAGSILFTLVAGEDHAHGDVVMVPRGRTEPYRSAERAGRAEGTGPGDVTARPLSIEFVRVAGDAVFGTLAPYTDPECGCTVLTTFEGRVTGDEIRGTFTTRHASHAGSAAGTWSARRSR